MFNNKVKYGEKIIFWSSLFFSLTVIGAVGILAAGILCSIFLNRYFAIGLIPAILISGGMLIAGWISKIMMAGYGKIVAASEFEIDTKIEKAMPKKQKKVNKIKKSKNKTENQIEKSQVEQNQVV